MDLLTKKEPGSDKTSDKKKTGDKKTGDKAKGGGLAKLPKPAVCPVIVFANHKGGVGKTMATVITAQLLANRGLKVLVIDTDSQGNASEALSPAGLSPTELPTVQACMEDATKTEYCIVDSRFRNVQLIAGSIAMEQPFPSESLVFSGARDNPREIHLTIDRKTVPFIYRVGLDSLKKVTERVKPSFDVILIDTAPSLGLTNQASIYAADVMIIPCSTAKHAVWGIPDIVRMAEDIRRGRGELARRVLVTLVDKRVRMDKVGRSILLSKFDCIGEIPRVSRLAENMYLQRPILNRIDKGAKELIEGAVGGIYQLAMEQVVSQSAIGQTTEQSPGGRTDLRDGAVSPSVETAEGTGREHVREEG